MIDKLPIALLFLFCNIRNTLFKQTSGVLFISVSQNLRTVQPASIRAAFTSLSRSIFLSILVYQNFWLDLWSFLCISQSLPCQKSPSRNTATFLCLNTKSGQPTILRSFLVYFTPASCKSFANMISILVPFECTFCILRCLCSGVSLSI